MKTRVLLLLVTVWGCDRAVVPGSDAASAGDTNVHIRDMDVDAGMADAGPFPLSVSLGNASCGCDLMPGAFDGYVALDVVFSNRGVAPVTGIKAVKASFEDVATGLSRQVALAAQAPFSGEVGAAGKASARFMAEGLLAGLPVPCGGEIRLSSSFASSAGTAGPFTSVVTKCQTLH